MWWNYIIIYYEVVWQHIYVYFNVNFNVFFKLIKVHLLVSELYIYQNAWCNDKNTVAAFVWRANKIYEKLQSG